MFHLQFHANAEYASAPSAHRTTAHEASDDGLPRPRGRHRGGRDHVRPAPFGTPIAARSTAFPSSPAFR